MTSKKRVLAWAIMGLILLSIDAFQAPPTLFLWNATPSVPVGLYLLTRAPVRRGDMVAARIPPPILNLAARRNYLPPSVPLVKHVAAARGDRLCAAGARILVNGLVAAIRRKSDPAGRPMPWWNGCRTLGPDELFLLAPAPLSFDGRYFGVSRRSEILGRAKLLWPA